MKKENKYIFGAGILFIVVVVFGALRPQPIDWSLSFSSEDKIPYGSFLVYEMLPGLFGKEHSEVSYESIYQKLALNNNKDYEHSVYVFINNYFNPDEIDANTLLDYVHDGNTAFIAARHFSGPLQDSLNISSNVFSLFNDFTEIDSLRSGQGWSEGVMQDSVSLRFVNPALKPDKHYSFKQGVVTDYLSSFDTSRTTILSLSRNGHPVFIRMEFGKGCFYISSVPLVYTNINMTKKATREYIETSLSYPAREMDAEGTLIWDEYYKAGKVHSNSPISYMLRQDALFYAYYVILGMLLILVVFNIKRKQRPIPEIPPLRNSTLDFVHTVGRLYFQSRDHRNIAVKKITYLKEYIREHYFIKWDPENPDFAQKLAAGSGQDPDAIYELIEWENKIQNANMITEEELIAFNRAVEVFYRQREEGKP